MDRVFVSSTWEDLQPERLAVERALNRLGGAADVGRESFGSRSEAPHDASLDEVDRSDIYVGIFGFRYGSGITEDEYRRAGDRGIPVLVYIKSDAVPVLPAHFEPSEDGRAKLAALKSELTGRHT